MKSSSSREPRSQRKHTQRKQAAIGSLEDVIADIDRQLTKIRHEKQEFLQQREKAISQKDMAKVAEIEHQLALLRDKKTLYCQRREQSESLLRDIKQSK